MCSRSCLPHLLQHAYNEQLFNLVRKISQFEVEFVGMYFPNLVSVNRLDEFGQNQF